MFLENVDVCKCKKEMTNLFSPEVKMKIILTNLWYISCNVSYKNMVMRHDSALSASAPLPPSPPPPPLNLTLRFKGCQM